MTGEPRPRLYLHIGLPKTGSTFLQAVLADNRDALQRHGYAYPYVGDEAMFRAALEMAGSPDRWGLSDDDVAGTFDRLVERGRRLGGTVVISHEVFSGATRREVDAIGERLGDFEVHVVAGARNPASTVTAQWQERVKNGVNERFADFAEAVVRLRPTDLRAQAPGFWHAHGLTWVLARWERLVPPERLHVVLTPDRSLGPGALWDRFAEAIGLPPGSIDPDPSGRSANESLGRAEIALLRRVLTELERPGGEVEQPWFSVVVKRWFAQSMLGPVGSPRPVAPASLALALTDAAQEWAEIVRERGYVVHGDLAELLPRAPGAEERHPDDVTDAELVAGVPGVLAAMLRHERDQRVAREELERRLREVTAERDRLRRQRDEAP